MKHLPNILTGLRLALALYVFVGLAVAGEDVTWLSGQLTQSVQWALERWSFFAFVVAAVTDFFDGWLARRWGVTSLMGTILDPIADKILVCGAIFGLLAVGAAGVLIPGAIILFREFAVSALREVLAPRGVKLPVTFLAKTKTTLQLVALGALMVIWFWPVWDLHVSVENLRQLYKAAIVVLDFAALVTVWTGLEYGWAARRALSLQAAKPTP